MSKIWIIAFAAIVAFDATASDSAGPLTLAAWSPICPTADKTTPKPKIAPVIGALLAIVAPKLVDAAVDHAGAAIKAAADTESRATLALPVLERFYTVTNTGELSLAPEVGCLVIVRAKYPTPSASGQFDIAKYDQDQLVFHLEAKLEPIGGLRYFQLSPKYLKTGKYELNSFWNSKRDMSVSVAMRSVSSPEPFASWTFQWQNLDPGAELKGDDLKLASATSGPLPYPTDLGDANSAKAIQAARVAPFIVAMDILDQSKAPAPLPRKPDDLKAPNVRGPLTAYCHELDAANKTLPEDARVIDRRCFVALNAAEEALKTQLGAAYKAKPSQDWANKLCPTYANDNKCTLPWATGIEESRFGAFVISTVLTESRPSNKFGLALASTITSSSDDMQKTLKEQVIPSEKKKAGEERDEKARETRRNMLLADLEVTAAESALSTLQAATPLDMPAIQQAQIELAKKKIAANDSYRKAGKPVPYPEFD